MKVKVVEISLLFWSGCPIRFLSQRFLLNLIQFYDYFFVFVWKKLRMIHNCNLRNFSYCVILFLEIGEKLNSIFADSKKYKFADKYAKKWAGAIVLSTVDNWKIFREIERWLELHRLYPFRIHEKFLFGSNFEVLLSYKSWFIAKAITDIWIFKFNSNFVQCCCTSLKLTHFSFNKMLICSNKKALKFHKKKEKKKVHNYIVEKNHQSFLHYILLQKSQNWIILRYFCLL